MVEEGKRNSENYKKKKQNNKNLREGSKEDVRLVKGFLSAS